MFANPQIILRGNRPWSEVSDWSKLAEFGPRAQTQLLSYAQAHCFWARAFSPLHMSLELSLQPDPSYSGTQSLSPVIRAHRFSERPLSRDPLWDTCPPVPHHVDIACRKPRSLSQLPHGVWREPCQGPDGCSGPAAPTLAGRPTREAQMPQTCKVATGDIMSLPETSRSAVLGTCKEQTRRAHSRCDNQAHHSC